MTYKKVKGKMCVKESSRPAREQTVSLVKGIPKGDFFLDHLFQKSFSIFF